jgi:thioredoxin-related protein
MKKILLTVLALYAFAGFAAVDFQDLRWKDAKKKAQIENKVIFVEFYTGDCARCVAFENEVLMSDTVGNYFNSRFLNIRIDVNKADGLVLASKYSIKTFPTVGFFNGDGDLIDLARGVWKSESFLKRVMVIENPDNYLTNLESKYKAGERSLGFMANYLNRLRESNQSYSKQVKEHWQKNQGALLLEEANWNLLSHFAWDVEDDQFKYVTDNREAFEKKFGQKQVLKYIEQAYSRSIVDAIIYDNSRKQERIKDALAKSDYEFRDTIFEKARSTIKITVSPSTTIRTSTTTRTSRSGEFPRP